MLTLSYLIVDGSIGAKLEGKGFSALLDWVLISRRVGWGGGGGRGGGGGGGGGGGVGLNRGNMVYSFSYLKVVG
jgi:hypothetical protein